jgi:hypothetical protein
MPRHGKCRERLEPGWWVCRHAAADLRDLLADVQDLLDAYSQGDTVNAERGEHRSGKKPHPPLPINLSRFVIAHPGTDEPIPFDYAHNGNPATGRLESNGPDAPDVWATIRNAAAAVGSSLGIDPDDGYEDYEGGGWYVWLVSFLRQHLGEITALEWFGEFVSAFRDCRRALAAAIGEPPGPVPLGKCPYCNAELFTDQAKEVLRRRRAGEAVSGEDAKPITARADRVVCRCGVEWSGIGLTRLRLILNPSPPAARLTASSEGNGWMAS